MEHALMITPKTRVLELIETYPGLEAVLIAYVPAFEKLKNPLLRKTVARIATLQQAAAIGKVPVEELINHLRREAGQEFVTTTSGGGYQIDKPGWFDESKITSGLDARAMLAAGEHPVNQVIADLRLLEIGKIYKLTAPFLPAPLIDKAASLNFRHWVVEEADGSCSVYFTPR